MSKAEEEAACRASLMMNRHGKIIFSLCLPAFQREGTERIQAKWTGSYSSDIFALSLHRIQKLPRGSLAVGITGPDTSYQSDVKVPDAKVYMSFSNVA